MTCTVSISQTVEVRTDYTPMVAYDGYDLNVYPAGVGVGPVIQLPWPEWQALVRDAQRAYDQYNKDENR